MIKIRPMKLGETKFRGLQGICTIPNGSDVEPMLRSVHMPIVTAGKVEWHCSIAVNMKTYTKTSIPTS